MAQDTTYGDDIVSLSSFRGRLDILNFKYAARDQQGAQETITSTRSSQRLSSKIDKTFKPTKHDVNSNIASKGARKRKADQFHDINPPEGRTTTRASLRGQAEMKPSSETLLNLEYAGPNGTSSLSTNQKQKKKRIRAKSGYAPPSTFAHLPPLPDAMGPNLHVLFCGLNPGIQTAIDGHAYSSPTNRFWKLMYSSGVLPVPCTPQEDRTLPKRFNLGLTNIVERPSRNGAQLSKAEMDAGVPVLESKVRRWRPEVICLVGKSIWESVWRVHHDGKAVGKDFNKTFKYGWQDETENMGIGDVDEKEDGVVYADDWKGARVFVSSSTSGLAATLSPAEKERIWRELGEWVERRRGPGERTQETHSVAS